MSNFNTEKFGNAIFFESSEASLSHSVPFKIPGICENLKTNFLFLFFFQLRVLLRNIFLIRSGKSEGEFRGVEGGGEEEEEKEEEEGVNNQNWDKLSLGCVNSSSLALQVRENCFLCLFVNLLDRFFLKKILLNTVFSHHSLPSLLLSHYFNFNFYVCSSFSRSASTNSNHCQG